MVIKQFGYAYHKVRTWHVGPVRASWLALRFSLLGDTGKFSSHGGWRMSSLRRPRPDDED